MLLVLFSVSATLIFPSVFPHIRHVFFFQDLTSDRPRLCLWPQGPRSWTRTRRATAAVRSATATLRSSAGGRWFDSCTLSWSCCSGSIQSFSLLEVLCFYLCLQKTVWSKKLNKNSWSIFNFNFKTSSKSLHLKTVWQFLLYKMTERTDRSKMLATTVLSVD